MSDAEIFLASFHDREPGATFRALGWGRLAGSDRSSYDHLAEVIPPGTAAARVVELACGDGELVAALAGRVKALDYLGVDLAEVDLAQARRRHGAVGISFQHARAQALPRADGTADYVLSHMAFMLFEDIDQVVAEIARVLAPGGRFAAVVGADDPGGDAWAAFGEVYRQIATGEPARADAMRLGDRRTQTADGLRALLAPACGFAAPIEIDDFTLVLDATVDQVWSSLALTYDPPQLSPGGRADLERITRQRLAGLAGADGVVPFRMGLRRVVAVRA